MNYAWEVALAADRSGMKREDVRYVPAQKVSPYVEVLQEDINIRDIGNGTVEVNPLFRFAREFSDLFDVNLEGLEKTREIFFDISLQYLVHWDLREGMSKQEYELRFLLRDLLDGVCGKQVSGAITRIPGEKLRFVLRLIRKRYRCGGSLGLFREGMRCLYPDSLVYASREEAHQLMIYVGKKETEEEQERMELLLGMFLPLCYEVKLFWEHHFGILDVEETMVLGEMVLF